MEDCNFNEEKLLTAEELAEKLNVKKSNVYYWNHVWDDFPCRKIGRLVRFKLSEIEDYFDKKQN